MHRDHETEEQRRRRMWLRCCDEEDSEPVKQRRGSGILLTDVLDLLHRIEQHRAALNSDLNTLHGWLNRSAELCQMWNKFTLAGGVTSADFAAVYNNARLARRPVARQRQHLRLITSNPTPRHRLRVLNGNDAA
jgi:hypothetical protein